MDCVDDEIALQDPCQHAWAGLAQVPYTSQHLNFNILLHPFTSHPTT